MKEGDTIISLSRLKHLESIESNFHDMIKAVHNECAIKEVELVRDFNDEIYKLKKDSAYHILLETKKFYSEKLNELQKVIILRNNDIHKLKRSKKDWKLFAVLAYSLFWITLFILIG